MLLFQEIPSVKGKNCSSHTPKHTQPILGGKIGPILGPEIVWAPSNPWLSCGESTSFNGNLSEPTSLPPRRAQSPLPHPVAPYSSFYPTMFLRDTIERQLLYGTGLSVLSAGRRHFGLRMV